MAGMHESCTVCGRNFEVQFRYQMEERDNAFSFFCSQACHGKSLRGGGTSGVVCTCCNKRFVVDLVSQVVRIKGEAKYACSDGCRTQLLAEAGGLRLGSAMGPVGASPIPGFAPNVVTPVTKAPLDGPSKHDTAPLSLPPL